MPASKKTKATAALDGTWAGLPQYPIISFEGGAISATNARRKQTVSLTASSGRQPEDPLAEAARLATTDVEAAVGKAVEAAKAHEKRVADERERARRRREAMEAALPKRPPAEDLRQVNAYVAALLKAREHAMAARRGGVQTAPA